MLSKRRCPHTGVVNFYFDTDPHLAVGSVVVRKGAKIFWSCHTEPFERSGVAVDDRNRRTGDRVPEEVLDELGEVPKARRSHSLPPVEAVER